MLRFNKILVHLGLLKITPKNVSIWATERNISNLILSLEMGTYKIRKTAATVLGNLKATDALTALAIASKDEVKVVAEAAMESLRKFLPSSKVEKVLKEAESFWGKREAAFKRRQEIRKANKSRAVVIYDKSKMQNLERLKQQLKRPIRSW